MALRSSTFGSGLLDFLRRIVTYSLVGLIRFYQRGISPLLGPSCRYRPTCSEYAILAVQKYGIFRGSLKSLCRIARCHPWGGSGWDPP